METKVITFPEETTEYPLVGRPHARLPRYSHDSERTDRQLQIGSSSTMRRITRSQQKRTESTRKEKIQEWWMGRVVNVDNEEGYFVANLEDSNGNECVAEFDIDTELKQDIFPKARFVFSVFTRHGEGSPETANRIEFIPPKIWTKGEKEKLEKIRTELFPDSPSLSD